MGTFIKAHPLTLLAPPHTSGHAGAARPACLISIRALGPAPCFACARPAPPPLSAGGSGVGSGRDVLLCPTSRRRRRRVRGRGAAGRRGPRRRRRRGRPRPPAHPGAPGRSAPMPARPPCGSPRSGGGGERRWGVGGRGAGAMCERGREAGGGRAPGGVRLRDRPGSRSEPS